MPDTPDSLVFDLDGTLWDTCEACARAWNVVLERNGIRFRTITAADVRRVTGKPHDLCIRETFEGLSEPELELLSEQTAVEDTRMIERDGGRLYEGVREDLSSLARSYRLLIVSNCQSGYIELFLAQSGLGAQFGDFECWGNTGRSKTENLRLLIERNRLEKPWLVGDTPGDLQAARACGVPFVHAAYGYGVCDQADLRLERFTDLLPLLNGGSRGTPGWPPE